MTDRRRPSWQSGILHLVLLAGAAVFALPYAWLVGTSWKLDKEIQSGEVRILPAKPVPSPVSPYLDSRQFADIARPANVSAERWERWMNAAVRGGIVAAIEHWRDDRAASLPADLVRNELAQGVFHRLGQLMPPEAWRDAEEARFKEVLGRLLSTGMVQECFDQAYRYLAIGQVKLQTIDYRVFDLTAGRPANEIWTAAQGPVFITPRREAEQSVAAVGYRFGPASQFEMDATFTVVGLDRLDDRSAGFKRLDVSYRNDETWHNLHLLVEMNGRLYESTAPRYLAGDQWAEAQFQMPGPDDQRLIPHRYILLKEIAAGPQYEHGPNSLKVRLQVQQSGQTRACWAKATENYRKAFDEVPFWRYFKTSVFLVIANIIGMVLSCSLVAYAFARLNWPGRDLCFVLVLATLMIPPQVTMIPSFVIYKYLGWYNTLAPLWVPNCLAINGFGIFLLRQAMKGIPKDLEEAAKIDGCGHLRIWWSIMLPLVKPTLAAISIFTFLAVWNDFMTPLVYVNDQRLYPLALGLFSFMVGRENQFTLIMASSVIMTLPVIIIFFLAQRHFIQGVAMSGMKN